MSSLNLYKEASNLSKNKYLKIGIIVAALLFAGGMSLQASYSTSGIWDIDIEVAGIGYDGDYTSYSAITGATSKDPNHVIYDPDGDPDIGSLNSMSSPGLKSAYDWTIGSFFHTDEHGAAVRDAGPKKIEDIDGIRHVTYYFGFSLSIISRSTHVDTPLAEHVYNFDYYGTTLISLYEVPEFATSSLVLDAGIILRNVDDVVPTECGVQSISMFDYETVYTTAESQGYPADIVDFNRQYDWIPIYNHEGYAAEPTNNIDYNSGGYTGRVSMATTLTPGSEYAITSDVWGGWIGGTFNVWDVEVLAHYTCEVLLTYELAADIGGYLDTRLDIGGAEDPEIYDIWFYLGLFLAGIMQLLGLDLNNPFSFIIVAVVAIIVIFILYKVLRTGARISPVGRMLGA